MLNIQSGFSIKVNSKSQPNQKTSENLKSELDIIPIVDISDDPTLYIKNESE